MRIEYDADIKVITKRCSFRDEKNERKVEKYPPHSFYLLDSLAAAQRVPSFRRDFGNFRFDKKGDQLSK